MRSFRRFGSGTRSQFLKAIQRFCETPNAITTLKAMSASRDYTDYGVDRIYTFRASRKLRVLLGRRDEGGWMIVDLLSRNDKSFYRRER